jgi:tRNA pseudouridine13 synthase
LFIAGLLPRLLRHENSSLEEVPRYRAQPEDFRVDEIALYDPTGSGGHTFLRIEKRLLTSDGVARQLAAAVGVPARDVGYAGRKDRAAVTTQWMSVPDLDPREALKLEFKGVRILEAIRHPHKLRTGQLRGNRFVIRIRGVDEELEGTARDALCEILARGMPNRFGAQRFGHGGRNAAGGRELLAGRRIARDRRKARFLLSALQSEVFNRVLKERPLPLDAVEEGDVAQVVDSGGLFVVEDAALENERAKAFEISATGPIFGTKMKTPTGVPAEREARILASMEIPLGEDLVTPRGIRLAGTRRPLRVRPREISMVRDEGALRLEFALPPGSYATVLLEELFGELQEGRG